MLVRKGEISLSFTTGMEFPNGMKLSFFSRKVVRVHSYLLTDRNHVSTSAVIMEFLSLLLTAWVEFSSEWYRSFQESNKYLVIDIDKGRGGTKCYWLMWDNDWFGA